MVTLTQAEQKKSQGKNMEHPIYSVYISVTIIYLFDKRNKKALGFYERRCGISCISVQQI